jgi:hypothetical protein
MNGGYGNNGGMNGAYGNGAGMNGAYGNGAGFNGGYGNGGAMNGGYGNGGMNGAGINQGYDAGVNRPNANVPGSGLSAGNLSGLNASGLTANSVSGNTAAQMAATAQLPAAKSASATTAGYLLRGTADRERLRVRTAPQREAVTAPPAAVAQATSALKQVPSWAVRKTMRLGALPRLLGVVLLPGNLSRTGRGGVSCVLGRSTTSANSARPLSTS